MSGGLSSLAKLRTLQSLLDDADFNEDVAAVFDEDIMTKIRDNSNRN